MTSLRKMLANQANSKKSTGPRTDRGKAASSRNSLRHGLLARVASLAPEEQQEFRALLDDLLDAWSPADVREQLLVHDITFGTFMKMRAVRLDCELLGTPTAAGNEEPALNCAALFERSSLMLDRVLRYVAAADRRVARAIATLTAMQKARAGEPQGEATDEIVDPEPEYAGPAEQLTEGTDADGWLFSEYHGAPSVTRAVVATAVAVSDAVAATMLSA